MKVVCIALLLGVLVLVGADDASWQNRWASERAAWPNAAQKLIKQDRKAESEQNENRIDELRWWLGDKFSDWLILGAILLQAYIYWKQSGIMRGQLQAARDAADAAKLTAEAAIGLELPLFAIRAGPTLQKDHPQCLLWLNNRGRTYGRVTSASMVLQAGRNLEPAPRYPLASTELLNLFVEHGQDILIARTNSVSAEDWDRALRGEIIVWIYGKIEFIDFLKNSHVSSFCFGSRPAPPSGLGTIYTHPTSQPRVARQLLWEVAGPFVYNYSGYKPPNQQRD